MHSGVIQGSLLSHSMQHDDRSLAHPSLQGYSSEAVELPNLQLRHDLPVHHVNKS